MKVHEGENRVILHQICPGLKANSAPLPPMIARIAVRQMRSNGVIFISGDVGKEAEKVARTTRQLLDSLFADFGKDFVVGFDIPTDLEFVMSERADETPEHLRNIFPPITDYKIAALHACAQHKVPFFCFGRDWENDRRVENPWRIGPRSLTAIWNSERHNLRAKMKLWQAVGRKTVLAVVDPWAASDKGLPSGLNQEPKTQTGLFDEPFIPWLNIKIGQAPLAGHQPWLEACFDWIIRTE